MEVVDSSVGPCHLLQTGVEDISTHLISKVQSEQARCKYLSQPRAGRTGGPLPAFHRSLVAPGHSRQNAPGASAGPHLPVRTSTGRTEYPARDSKVTFGSCDFSFTGFLLKI